MAAMLENLSPRRVLERGYAIVFDDSGRIMRTADQAVPGQHVAVQLADGRIDARVERATPGKDSSA
jgi:exodeoxyribonuclease VII large subunit